MKITIQELEFTDVNLGKDKDKCSVCELVKAAQELDARIQLHSQLINELQVYMQGLADTVGAVLGERELQYRDYVITWRVIVNRDTPPLGQFRLYKGDVLVTKMNTECSRVEYDSVLGKFMDLMIKDLQNTEVGRV